VPDAPVVLDARQRTVLLDAAVLVAPLDTRRRLVLALRLRTEEQVAADRRAAAMPLAATVEERL